MAVFTFSIQSQAETAQSLSLGDLTITGNVGRISSKGDSRYLMMVFLAITDLLDGVRELILNDSIQGYEFIGIDGSFRIHFQKKSPTLIVIKAFGRVISQETPTQLVQELWKSIQDFVSGYRGRFENTDTGVEDLDASIQNFSQAFANLLRDT